MNYKPFIPDPENSPWGEVQHCIELAYGFFEVSTAGHGGIMVHRDVARAALSNGALKAATMQEGGYYCYEEDCDAAIPFRELLDKPDWKLPPDAFNGTQEKFEKIIDQSLINWNPEYVAYRERQGKAVKSKNQLSLEDMVK